MVTLPMTLSNPNHPKSITNKWTLDKHRTTKNYSVTITAQSVKMWTNWTRPRPPHNFSR